MLNYNLIDNKKSEYIVLLHAYGGNSKCFKRQLSTLSNFFNILLIDMHGHGKSANIHLTSQVTTAYKKVADDINLILENLDVKKAHFMGLSLGTIVAKIYAYYYPSKVLSILNAGAVIKFKPFIQRALSMVYSLREALPHRFFYSLAGYIIMPNKSHRVSRDLFVREAKKMNSSDFYAWGRLLIDFQDIYSLDELENNIDTLYISGKEDYFFIDEVKQYCHNNNSNLCVLEHAGHICNIDNSSEFNKVIDKFYRYLYSKKDAC